MDVLGKSYSTHMSERHPSRSKRIQKAEQRPQIIYQAWEIPVARRAKKQPPFRIDVRKAKRKQKAQIWIRPTSPSKSILEIVSSRKEKPPAPSSVPEINRPFSSRGSRPTSSSGYMKKSRSKKPKQCKKKNNENSLKVAKPSTISAWAAAAPEKVLIPAPSSSSPNGNHKKERSSPDEQLAPSVNTKVSSNIHVPDYVTDEDILDLEQKIALLEESHTDDDADSRSKTYDKFVKAIKLEEKQARKIPTSSHLMFPIGTGERDMLLLSQEMKEKGNIQHTEHHIKKAEQDIKLHKESMMKMKSWNAEDRQIWKLKMQLEMFKLIKSKGGRVKEDTVRVCSKEKSQRSSSKTTDKSGDSTITNHADSHSSKFHQVQEKKEKQPLASRSGISTPWGNSIPYKSDGSVVPAKEKEKCSNRNTENTNISSSKEKKYFSMADSQETMNPLKLLEKSRGDGYQTSNSLSYGAFYSDPKALATIQKEVKARKEAAKACKSTI